MTNSWVPFHSSLREGEKRGLSRATRFIFLELSLLARPFGGVLPLPRGFRSDADALHDLLGGNRREVSVALKELTTQFDPEDPNEEPMVVVSGTRDRRVVSISSHSRYVKQASSTHRVRRFRARQSQSIQGDEQPGNATGNAFQVGNETPLKERREEKRREEKKKQIPQTPFADSEVSGVHPIGVQPSEPESPEPLTSEQKYQAAYCAGIARGKRSPFAFPQSIHAAGDLNSVLLTHALSADGKKLRGAALLEWITDNAAAFAEHAMIDGAEYFSSYAPKGFVRWCNLGRPGFVAKPSPASASPPKSFLMKGITQADLDAATAAVASAPEGSKLAERRDMLRAIMNPDPEVKPLKAGGS